MVCHHHTFINTQIIYQLIKNIISTTLLNKNIVLYRNVYNQSYRSICRQVPVQIAVPICFTDFRNECRFLSERLNDLRHILSPSVFLAHASFVSFGFGLSIFGRRANGLFIEKWKCMFVNVFECFRRQIHNRFSKLFFVCVRVRGGAEGKPTGLSQTHALSQSVRVHRENSSTLRL